MSKKYRIDTDKGSYIVETDEPGNPNAAILADQAAKYPTASELNGGRQGQITPPDYATALNENFFAGAVPPEQVQATLGGGQPGFLANTVSGLTSPAGLLTDAVTAGAGLLAARPAMQGTAARLYESALKPGPRSNTLDEVQRMVGAGLREGIPVSSGGMGKLDSLVDALNTRIANTINTGSNAGATVNKYAVASRLSDTAKRFAMQVNPEADLAAISESGHEFLRNQPMDIPAQIAQALKQGTYKQLRDKAYSGELKSASVESQKALARGSKEELVALFPQIQGMNLRESDLLGLKDELAAAINRQRNKEMIGIGTPILGTAVAAGTHSGPLGLAAALGKATLDHPAVKSRLAIALARLAR